MKPDPKQTHFFGEMEGRSVHERSTHGMSGKTALRLEMSIIGLGILALVLIFQPFSITVLPLAAA